MSAYGDSVIRGRVYNRLLKTDARFRKLDEILGDEVSVSKTLAVWDWFERCLDTKEAVAAVL